MVEGGSSNNLPEYPAIYFLDTVKELGGCPVEVVTDFGTENSLLASIQSYIRETPMLIGMSLHHGINVLKDGGPFFPKTGQHGGEICFRT